MPSSSAVQSETEIFSQKAWQHIEMLAGEIGARPAGSLAEQKAFDYIGDRLKEWGYDILHQKVLFTPPYIFPVHTLGGLLLIAGGWLFDALPWLALCLPLVLYAIPHIDRITLPLSRHPGQSQNVVTYTKSAGDIPKGAGFIDKRSHDPTTSISSPCLIFCAHVDSAPASPFRFRSLLKLASQAMFLAQRGAIALASLALLYILGFQIPLLIHDPVILVGTITGGWLAISDLANQIRFSKRFSPGANDDASGVGILLSLAEYYATAAPQHIQLGFLFTGAEETGMHGAQAFAELLQDINHPIYILNLDMVGIGDSLQLVTKDGTLVQKTTSKELNQLIKRAYPEAIDVWYTLKSGDFLPFLKKNIPATSIEMTGSAYPALTYHTIFDTAEKIDARTLDTVLQTLIQVTSLTDKKFTP